MPQTPLDLIDAILSTDSRVRRSMARLLLIEAKLSPQVPDLPGMSPIAMMMVIMMRTVIMVMMVIVVVPPKIIVVPAKMVVVPPKKIPWPAGPIVTPAGQAAVGAVEEGILPRAIVIKILDVAPNNLRTALDFEVIERPVHGAQLKTVRSPAVELTTFAWPCLHGRSSVGTKIDGGRIAAVCDRHVLEVGRPGRIVRWIESQLGAIVEIERQIAVRKGGPVAVAGGHVRIAADIGLLAIARQLVDDRDRMIVLIVVELDPIAWCFHRIAMHVHAGRRATTGASAGTAGFFHKMTWVYKTYALNHRHASFGFQSCMRSRRRRTGCMSLRRTPMDFFAPRRGAIQAGPIFLSHAS